MIYCYSTFLNKTYFFYIKIKQVYMKILWFRNNLHKKLCIKKLRLGIFCT